MRYHSLQLTFVLLLLTMVCHVKIGAQQRSSIPVVNGLFQIEKGTRLNRLAGNAANADQLLRLNTKILDSLCKAQPDRFLLELPLGASPTQTLAIVLTKVTPPNRTLHVKTEHGIDTLLSGGVHYWGQIEGTIINSGSISLFENEVMGFIGDTNGQRWTLGKLGDVLPGDLYALYAESSLSELPEFSCEAGTLTAAYRPADKLFQSLRSGTITPTNKTVQVYLESEYELYQQKGSVNNVVNYLSGLMNEVARIYQMEGINLEVSEFFVWTSADPYPTDALAALLAFRSARVGYNGDLAHLVTLGAGSRYSGIAYVSGFCNIYGYGYSQIQSAYNSYPSYSWSVNVLAHELGHNFGSPHTHDCAWNGNNTAIDGCGPVVGSPTNGCATLPPPTSPYKGTIMSYCHAVAGIGIDLALGFGEQPGNLLRTSVSSAVCLPCDAPRDTAISSTTSSTSTATLLCNTQGVSKYDWRYRIMGSNSWTDVNFTTISSFSLNGLQSGGNYEYQVAVQCPDGNWSNWSNSKLFTLPASTIDSDMGGVTDVQEQLNGTNPNDAADDFLAASLQLKVLLQGALFSTTNGIMQDNLRTGGYIPLTDPYHSSSNSRFSAYGSGAITSTNATALSAGSGSKNAIVDWIFVELRDSSNAAQIVETIAALLQRDGDVVSAADGVSPLRFSGNLLARRYYVAVKHRNHLGVMYAKSVQLRSIQSAVIDFRTMADSLVYDKPGSVNYDGAEMARINITTNGGDFGIGTSIKALWAGNANQDQAIKFQGNANDVVFILQGVLNYPGNQAGLYNYGTATGYFSADVDLSGVLKYQGGSNDPTFILNSLLSFPRNSNGLFNYGTFVEQLP